MTSGAPAAVQRHLHLQVTTVNSSDDVVKRIIESCTQTSNAQLNQNVLVPMHVGAIAARGKDTRKGKDSAKGNDKGTNSIATIFAKREARDVDRKDNKNRQQMTACVSLVTGVGTLLKTAECMVSAIFHRYLRYMSSHPGLGCTSGNECVCAAVTFFHV